MAQRYDTYRRLEPDPQRRSFAAGFAASAHDPLWFLARQWQMGEHQGENASTPVQVIFDSVSTAVEPAPEMRQLDPLKIPLEAIIEGEPDDWWTLGRRIRLGAVMARRLRLVAGTPAATRYRFEDPPPPYESLTGSFDGLALWRDRASLDADRSRFGDLGIPEPRHTYWRSDELIFQAEFPLAGETGHSLVLPRHRGSSVDWYSADAASEEGSGVFAPAAPSTPSQVYPTALQYPGAPRSRWWEIEDAAVDLGGYPPDTSHFPTTLLIDLVASHSDDWFLFPVDARAGHVLTLVPGSVKVKDGFGDWFTLSPPEKDWSLFRTSGLDPTSLLVWLRAVTPLQGEPLEQVLLGTDEYSNMLWAVELRVDSREMTPPVGTPEQEAANPPLAKARGAGKPGEQKSYLYVPGQDAVPHWHPYELVDDTDAAGLGRRFVQRRLADLGHVDPELLPPATARLLRSFGPTGEVVHEINPSTIPAIGVTLERRCMLARDVRGNPLLWTRRLRMPFLAPPGRRLRYDVMAEDTGSQ